MDYKICFADFVVTLVFFALLNIPGGSKHRNTHSVWYHQRWSKTLQESYLECFHVVCAVCW
jgi:hypothetical protein